jgi:hypothetical protein
MVSNCTVTLGVLLHCTEQNTVGQLLPAAGGFSPHINCGIKMGLAEENQRRMER